MTDDLSDKAIRSAESREALLAACRILLQRMASRAPGGSLPYSYEHRVIFLPLRRVQSGDGIAKHHDWSEQPSRAAAAWLIKLGDRTELMALPDVANAVRVLWENGDSPDVRLSDEAGDRITAPTFEQVKYHILDRILSVVRTYVNEFETFALDPVRLLQAYARSRVSELAELVEYEMIAPLIGFDSEVATVELPDSISIVTMSHEMKTDLWRRGSLGSFIGFNNFREADFAVRQQYQRSPRSDGNATETTVAAAARRTLTALRLLHEGSVTAPARCSRRLDARIRGPGRITGLDAADHGFYPFSPFQLRSTEHTRFCQLYEQLRRAESNPAYSQLALGLRRFNGSYSRRQGEDKIIDLTIALESSVLFGISTELQYRLASRGATLLRHAMPPEESATQLKTLYEIRSLLVHEGKSLTDIVSAARYRIAFSGGQSAFVTNARQLVRLALQQFVAGVAEGRSVKHMAEGLDIEILGCLASAHKQPRQE